MEPTVPLPVIAGPPLSVGGPGPGPTAGTLVTRATGSQR